MFICDTKFCPLHHQGKDFTTSYEAKSYDTVWQIHRKMATKIIFEKQDIVPKGRLYTYL